MSAAFSLSKLNNYKIEVPKTKEDTDTRPIKGSELIHELYAFIFGCASKKSGKSVVAFNLIKECSGEGKSSDPTKIVAFVGTINQDSTWIAIKDYCKKRNIEFDGFNSIFDQDGNDRIQDYLNLIRSEVDAKLKKKEKEKLEKGKGSYHIFGPGMPNEYIMSGKGEPDEKLKKRRAPKYLFVFDDLSSELRRSRALVELMKENRHFLCKLMIFSQYLKDLAPEGLRQVDVWLIWKGMDADLLQTVYKDSGGGGLPFDQFIALYRRATDVEKAGPHAFFYFDKNVPEFRTDFSIKLNPSESKD